MVLIFMWDSLSEKNGNWYKCSWNNKNVPKIVVKGRSGFTDCEKTRNNSQYGFARALFVELLPPGRWFCWTVKTDEIKASNCTNKAAGMRIFHHDNNLDHIFIHSAKIRSLARSCSYIRHTALIVTLPPVSVCSEIFWQCQGSLRNLKNLYSKGNMSIQQDGIELLNKMAHNM